MSDTVRPESSGAAKVEIYTRRYCGYCVRAKILLDEKGINYIEIPIDGNAEARQQMMARAQGAYTVPQIFINGVSIGGCSELFMLESRGELERLLASV